MIKNLLLLLFSILLTLGLAEIALRIVDIEKPKPPDKEITKWAPVPERVWTEYHPKLGWYHQSNKAATLALAHGEVTIHTNGAGFRGEREYDVPKSVGTTRIAIIGDSFTFGFGVEDDEAYPAQLEKREHGVRPPKRGLTPNTNKREVLNLGVPGWGVDQFLIAYRELLWPFKPDVVAIGIFPEDFWRATRSFADSGHSKPWFKLVGEELVLQNVPVPAKFTQKTNQFPEVIEYEGIKAILRKSVVYRMASQLFLRLGKNTGLIDPKVTPEWILGRAILKQMVKEIEDAGAKPLVLILPPDRWMKLDEPTALHESIKRFCEREKIPILDMTPAFKKAVGESTLEDYYIEGDWHWTVRGHALAAKLIDSYVTHGA